MNDRDRIRKEIEEEIRRSKHRNRISGARIHPIQAHINRLHGFVITRRTRVPGALAAVLASLRAVDVEAQRFVINVVRTGGVCDLAILRVCDQVEGYCNTLTQALALKAGRR